ARSISARVPSPAWSPIVVASERSARATSATIAATSASESPSPPQRSGIEIPKRPSSRAPSSTRWGRAPARSWARASTSRARKRRVVASIASSAALSTCRLLAAHHAPLLELRAPRRLDEAARVLDGAQLHRVLHRQIDPELLREPREELQALQ